MKSPRTTAAGAGPSGEEVVVSNQRFAALASPNFRNIWIGFLITNMGAQMQVVGLGWLVRDLHEEPIYLGVLGLSFALPVMLLTPLGGAIADRHSRVLLLKLSIGGMVAQALVLSALTLWGVIGYWHVLLLNAINAGMVALSNPTRQALMPDLVPREHLPSAVSLFSVIWTGSALVGPALGGLLLAWFGLGWLFVANAVAYTAVLWAVYSLRNLPPEQLSREGSLLGGVKEGIVYAFRDPLIASLLLLLAAMAFFGRTHLGLMPTIARDILGTGPLGYGLLLAAPGAGALIGGIGLASLGKVEHLDRVSLTALGSGAAFLILFSASRSFELSLVLALLTGGAMTIGSAGIQTTLQLRTPGQLRGRVMSLSAVAILGLTNLSPLGGSAIATWTDVPTGVAVMAGLLLALVLASIRRLPWPVGTDNPPPVHREPMRTVPAPGSAPRE